MTRRGRWVALGAAAVAALLVGRLAVGILADRWWAEALDPAFAAPVTRLHLVRAGIEGAAVGLGALWFTLHLLLVVRAVHRVEIPRYLGNLEFRETVRRRTLVALAAGLGLVLGILTGFGAAGAWQPLALWLTGGVRFGLADPVLGRDLGAYVASLPAQAWLQGFAVRLGVLGLATTAVAYTLVGAIRWEGRLAVSDHARRHLAVLLVLLALALGWGHALDPARWLSAPDGAGAGLTTWRMTEVGSTAMIGVALGTATLSAAWAWTARPLLVAAAWVVFTIASLAVRAILPAAADPGPPLVDDATRRGLDVVAWGLRDLERPALPTAPMRPGLWHPAVVARAVGGEPGDPASVTPGVVGGTGSPRPAWFAVRPTDSAFVLVALADDRVAAGGAPLSYRGGDTLAYPGVAAWGEAGDVHPGAWGVVRDAVAGVRLGGVPRRLALAWALQEPGFLRGSGFARWHRTPVERLHTLIPWVTWDRPVAAEVEGDTWWLSAGLIPLRSFAGTTRAPVMEGEAGGVEHALVGLVRARDGRTRVFLAPGAGPVASRYARLSAPIIEPAGSLPPAFRAALAYPAGLFEAQALVVSRGPWGVGRLSAPGLSGVTVVRDGEGRPVPTAAYEDSTGRRIRALLLGLVEDGGARPVLRRTGEEALPAPGSLVSRWSRFPVWEQLRDSAIGAGARVEAGPVRYQVRGTELTAWQAQFATGPGQRPALLWVSVAAGTRLGAGRSLEEAWRNLGGLDAPLPPGLGGTRLDEARRWLARADSALRAGDWAAFGRAFEALRATLGSAAADSGR